MSRQSQSVLLCVNELHTVHVVIVALLLFHGVFFPDLIIMKNYSTHTHTSTLSIEQSIAVAF